jgi:hypothetical protein
MSGADPRPIDTMIAGAQKAGTSSLAYYLGQHPEICTHKRLELSYFVDELDYALGYAENFDRYFAHCSAGSRLLGKSVTVMTEPRLIDRMREHNPRMRLLVILRNPVDRAYSAYWWARRKGYETLPTFEAALDADPARHGGNVVKVRSTSYRPFGHYAPQIAALFDRFGREQVQVHLFEDLKADAPGVCARAFEHIGVDPAFAPDVSTRRNTSSLPRSSGLARLLSAQHPLKRGLRRVLPKGMAEAWKRRAERWNRVSFSQPPMRPETREALVRHFRPLNDELAELIGRDLSAWNSLDAGATQIVGDD